jgi:hypothetical protein
VYVAILILTHSRGYFLNVFKHTFGCIHTIHTHTTTTTHTHTHTQTRSCGDGDQTTDHIIYDCPRLKEERNKLRAAVNKTENWPVSKGELLKRH